MYYSSGYIISWITTWGEKLHDKSTTNANLVIKGKLMKLLLCESQGLKSAPRQKIVFVMRFEGQCKLDSNQ